MSSDKNEMTRGAIVEFDFAVADGAQVLFDTAKKVLGKVGIDLTVKLEALKLTGKNYVDALDELFEEKEIKADAAEVAGELVDEFKQALDAKAKDAVTAGFKAFVSGLNNNGIKVVILTRCDAEVIKSALGDVDEEMVVFAEEQSVAYGCCRRDSLRRVLSQNKLADVLTTVVTGSGAGVKSALIAGMSALAVVNDRVAYQDFGGADFITEDALNVKCADVVAHMLHVR